MRTASSGFVISLQALDPLLSVRWGELIERWVIERKAWIGQEELRHLRRRFARLSLWVKDESRAQHQLEKKVWGEVGEELRSALEGKRVVLRAKDLNRETYEMLCLGDIARYGGYSRLADEIEKRELEEEERQENARSAYREELHRESYDVLHFLWEKRGAKLDHGERDLNVLLHGRKRSKPALEIVEAGIERVG